MSVSTAAVSPTAGSPASGWAGTASGSPGSPTPASDAGDRRAKGSEPPAHPAASPETPLTTIPAPVAGEAAPAAPVPVPAPAPAPAAAPAAASKPVRPAVARTRAELAELLARPIVPRDPAAGRGTRAVVMTMGALHRGHAELIRAARRRADQVVVTIFVNPLQFGPSEDFDRYPRTLEADLELCAAEGVDIVFAPASVHDPAPLVRVSAGPLGEILEGASRPGHFDGVLTIVATLLHLIRPDLAFFGRKDAQQLVCIRRMVHDLAFPVEIVGVPTVRDPDGLALSSRNAYLTSRERESALALSRALAAGVAAAAGADSTTAGNTTADSADRTDPAGTGDCADRVLAAARAVLDAEPGVELDYLTLASPEDLSPVRHGPALLLVAARVGRTRLIDNIELTLPEAGAAPAQPNPARSIPADSARPAAGCRQGV